MQASALKAATAAILSCVATAVAAQAATPGQAKAIAEAFSRAAGFVSGVAAQAGNGGATAASGAHRATTAGGVRVRWAEASSSNAIIPVSVLAPDVPALQRVNKELAETTERSLRANLGPPAESSEHRVLYVGPAEICRETMELRLAGGKVVAASWTFCVD